jgi:hypothetical protein
MPLIWNLHSSEEGRDYGTSDRMPAIDCDDEHEFHVLTGCRSARCAACSQDTSGLCWGGSNWVVCGTCAERHGAPPLPGQITDDNYDPNLPEHQMRTKRDPDFNPAHYNEYLHHSALVGRNGCSGYRCEFTPHPSRTIPARTKFMLSNDDKGHLCMGCFAKLSEQFKRTEHTRTQCQACGHTRLVSSMRDTVHDGSICNNCIAQNYINTPYTDGGFIRRRGAQHATITFGGVQTLAYASIEYAEENWFRGRGEGVWHETQAAADESNFTIDAAYQRDRLLRHEGASVFSYGTNIIRMCGFPAQTNRDALCFGVELEMVPKPNTAHEAVVEALGGKWVTGRGYILCRDGSLGDAGVEMITLPYTLADHKSDKAVPWNDVLSKLQSVAMSGKGTKACGIHVHINRRALSTLTMGKMLMVINAPEMQQLVAVVAQRAASQWSHRAFTKISDGKKVVGSHYDALNTATNKGTCELRIFRGNLRWERVMKNLEFTEALCLYSQEQSMQRLRDPKLMIEWINDHRGEYPHLVKFLAQHYKATAAFKRTATVCARDPDQWSRAATAMRISETEGDI